MTDISRILDLPVVSVLEKYITLKRAGANYKACCPFHGEKTPSLVVSPAKNIWKCFGCGAGGNAVNFVMQHEKIEFMDAVRTIAKQHGIHIEEKPITDEERKVLNHKENLRVVNKFAAEWFEANLYLPENKKHLEYALSRWDAETLRMFSIGYAPDNYHGFESYSRSKGIKRDIAIEAGLIKQAQADPTNVFDHFRNRLIIPIHDHLSRVVGFTGRTLNPNEPAKYLNTPENDIFKKGDILFGFNVARRYIAERRHAILVEGNADVIRMHEIGILETVATQGTALTTAQINLIKSVADSVTIIGDNDKAGITAVDKNAKLLISAGIFVNVIPLIAVQSLQENPIDAPATTNNKQQTIVIASEARSLSVVEVKQPTIKSDPDSFFKTKEQYNEYANKNITSFLVYYTSHKKKNSQSSDRTAQIISEVASLLACLPDSMHTLLVEELTKIIKPKSVWVDELKKAIKEKESGAKETKENDTLTPDQVECMQKYGFYEDQNCYWFAIKESFVMGSNFTMKPLFHVQSVNNAKRLYEIKNHFNHTETIELAQKDLISLQAFKLRVESLGNFLWEMSDVYLNKLKRMLYENTQTCVEVTQLGWQKAGFYAWGNGIFSPEAANAMDESREFQKSDKYGIVSHKKINYYLPAFSSIYEKEDKLYEFERKFIHTDAAHINMYDYVTKLLNVFGDNAMVAFSFYLGSLFRDIVAHRFGFFPILNCFGPKGTGKTEMARSLTAFFGIVGNAPNISNTTKAALADHVSQVSNGCVHIDEYRNDIELEKIEFLKGIWDGTGRSRMNMDKDKKKETTAVDCAVVLTGQQIPTADIALFSRLVYITFYQTEYSVEQKEAFIELKDIEKHGLTHLTHEVLALRSYFLKNYNSSYEQVVRDIQENVEKNKVEDRVFRNWAAVIAAAHCLLPRLSLPFDYKKILTVAIAGIHQQAKETFSSNEISTFWNLVQYMDNQSMIMEKADYRLEYNNKYKFYKSDDEPITIERAEPFKVIILHWGRIISLYRELGNRQKINILPPDTIRRYLLNSNAYLGFKNSVRWIKLDKNGSPEYTREDDGLTTVTPKEWITRGYAFDYDALGIDLTFHSIKEDDVPF